MDKYRNDMFKLIVFHMENKKSNSRVSSPSLRNK